MTKIGKITRNAHKQIALSPKKEVIKWIYFSLKSTNFQMVDKTFIENLEGENGWGVGNKTVKFVTPSVDSDGLTVGWIWKTFMSSENGIYTMRLSLEYTYAIWNGNMQHGTYTTSVNQN